MHSGHYVGISGNTQVKIKVSAVYYSGCYPCLTLDGFPFLTWRVPAESHPSHNAKGIMRITMSSIVVYRILAMLIYYSHFKTK